MRVLKLLLLLLVVVVVLLLVVELGWELRLLLHPLLLLRLLLRLLLVRLVLLVLLVLRHEGRAGAPLVFEQRGRGSGRGRKGVAPDDEAAAAGLARHTARSQPAAVFLVV